MSPCRLWRYEIQVADEAVVHGYSGACKTEVCTEPTGVREEETRIPHMWKEQGTRWAKKPFLLGKGCWRLSGNHIGGERCLGCGWYAAPYGPHVVGPGPVSLPPEWCCFIYSSLSYRPQATLGLHHLPQLLRRLPASAPAFSLSPPAHHSPCGKSHHTSGS